MKKLSLLLVVILSYLASFSQTPNTVTASNPQTTFTYLGPLTSNGYKIKGFTDTTTINNQMYLKGIPGLLVRVGNNYYVRSNDASQWILINAPVPNTPGTFIGIDSVTINSDTTKVCYWKQGVSTCLNLGGDSVRVVGDTSLCIYTNGSANCYPITGNVLVVNQDSMTVNGSLVCWYFGGTPTCITINPVGAYFNDVELSSDSLYMNFKSNGVYIKSIPTFLKGVASGDTCIVIRDSSDGKTYWYFDPNCGGGGAFSPNNVTVGGLTLVDSTVSVLPDITLNYNGVQTIQSTPSTFVFNTIPSGYFQTNTIYINGLTAAVDTLIGITDTAFGVPRELLPNYLLIGYVNVFGQDSITTNVASLYQGKAVPFIDSVTHKIVTDSLKLAFSNSLNTLYVPANGKIAYGFNNGVFLQRNPVNGYFQIRQDDGRFYGDWLGGVLWSFTPQLSYFNSPLTVADFAETNTPSALLKLNSTTKAMLLMRMTGVQMNLISPAVAGMVVYNTDSASLCYYNGSAWIKVGAGTGGSSGWSLTGNAGTNPATDFMGTTDNVGFVLKANNNEVIRIGTNYNVSIGAGSSASGSGSIALGNTTSANGNSSTSMGNTTSANGVNSTAMGFNTVAGGGASTAMGSFTTASGAAATAMGEGAIASGDVSVAIGDVVTASGKSSTAVGTNFTNANDSSFEVGFNSSALHVDKTNNVGIGTTTPATKLHIASTDTLALRVTGMGNSVVGTDSVVVRDLAGNFKVAAKTESSGGTITGVTAGINLTGGGTSGTVTLNSDTTTGVTKLATQGFVSRTYQPLVALTTTGTSGAATFTPSTGALNIPNYTLSGLGGWSTTGNSSISRTTNFLGTTDNTPVPVRINNIIVATWDTANKQKLGIGNKLNHYFGSNFYSQLRIFDTAFLANNDYNTCLTIVPEYAITSGNFTSGAIGGMQSEVRINGTNTGNFNSYYPVYSYRGSRNVQANATGTINHATSYHAVADVSGMTTTLSSGFFAENPFTHGSAVITNNVGLYIQRMTAGTNNYGILDSSYNNQIIAGVLPDLSNALKITATMPTTISATNNMVEITGTGAGSSAQSTRILSVTYGAGYTGSANTLALSAANNSVGTGASLTAANWGAQIGTISTTTGWNIGVLNYANGGNVNIGTYGRGTGVKNSAVNIGVLGVGRNSATSGIGIPGYFTQDTAALITSAATTVLIDNGNQANPSLSVFDAGTRVITFGDGGNTFFGGTTTAPTAKIQIGASTTAASTASIKINEGSRQTTPEDGTINYIANNLEFVETSTVYTLAKTLTSTATLNFDLTAVNSQDLTMTVTGAATGDVVALALDANSVPADITYFGWVSATNTVTIRCSRVGGGGAADPASGTFRASVIKY